VTSLSDPSSLIAAFRSGFAPPPATTIDEWAEACRYLPTETSANAGMWRNAKTPWMVEVMRELSPTSKTQEIVLMTSARTAKTEGGVNNPVGFYMDAVRCPIMVAMPIEADAEEWSKDHLDPMIAHTPSLARLITPDKDRRKGNTILHKKYRGGVVYVVGANSSKSFRRRTIRVLLCDELDAWPGTLAGEGDPYTLAKERTSTFPYSKKILASSTPTIKGSSRIETAFLDSDQRHYHVPCPECGLYQRLIFSRVQIGKELDQDGFPMSEYLCDPQIGGCGVLIPHHRKEAMVARGRWVPTFPGRRVAGFQISALYSPWVSWGQLASEWAAAQGDPQREQVFVNTKLGETYDASSADAWDPDGLMLLREPLAQLPAHAVVVTSAVDVQGDRLVFQASAWGPGEERWTLERVDIIGDPGVDPNNPASVWAELDAILMTRRYAHALGGSLAIRATCVDTGGLYSAQAYKFCRARRSRRVWAIKGDSGREGTKLWPQTPSRKNKGNLPLYLLGVFAGKESCMSRLRASLLARQRGEVGGPGYWHFAAVDVIGPAYFEELTAETCVVDYAGTRGGRATSERRRRWQLRSSSLRNEALDCSVYEYAALHGLLSLGLRLERTAKTLSDAPTTNRISEHLSSQQSRSEMQIPAPAPTKPPPAPPAKAPAPAPATRPRRPRWEP